MNNLTRQYFSKVFITGFIFLVSFISLSSERTIKVGVYDNPPKIFMDSNNQPAGFFIDILEVIALRNNFSLEYIQGTWQDHLGNLEAGVIDLLPDVARTPERASRFRMNDIAVIQSWVQFFSLPGNEVNTVQDLSKKHVAVLKESVQHEYMEDEFADRFEVEFALVAFDTYKQAIEALINDDVDVLMADRFFSFFSDNDVRISPGTLVLNPSSLHFAFSKRIEEDVVVAFDRTLRQIINDPGSDYYKSLNNSLAYGPGQPPPVYKNWIFILSMLGFVLLIVIVYRLSRKLIVRSRELQFRSGILESANKMLEELLDERRNAEIAIKESEEAFKSLFLQSTDPISLLKNERFEDCNPSALNFLGYSQKEQFLGKTIEDISPEYQPDGQRSETKARELIAHALRKGNHRFEWIHLRANSQEITVEVVLTLITFKGEKLLHVSWRDITDRKEAEIALRESEERYRLLVNNQTDLIVKVDKEGRFSFVSPSYCVLFGKKPEELLGNTFLPLVHPEDRETTRLAMEKLYEPPFNCTLEQRALTVKGWRWLSWVDTAILNENGEVKEIIGVGRDVTENVFSQKELLSQKLFIQKVLDNLPIGVAVNEFESGKASYMNKKFAEIYGWPQEQLIDIESFFQLVYPEKKYREKMKKRIMLDVESGDAERMMWDNIEIVTQKGEKRIISAINIPLIDQNIMVSTVQDTTQAKLDEAAIEKERDKLQMLFSIARKIGQAGSLEDVLFYTLERICVDNAWDLGEAWWPSADQKKMLYSGAYYYADNSLGTFVEESKNYSFEKQTGIAGRVWEEKRVVWVNDLQTDSYFLRQKEAAEHKIKSAVGIPILAENTVVCVLVFFMKQPREEEEQMVQLVMNIGMQLGELFKRKSIVIQKELTLQKLQESEYQLRQAQKIGSIGSWEYDFNTSEVTASEEARKIYGLPDKPLTIEEAQKVIVGRYRNLLDEALKQHKETGKPYNVVFQIVRPSDNQLRFIHSIAEFHHEKNKLIGIIRDVTESKTNERLKQEIMVANESARFKQNFLAQMSHEIRTPLTAIDGMLELMEKTRLDDTQKDFLDTVKFSSENLRGIINEVLDYSRIEAGGIRLNPVDFPVKELFVKAEKLFQSINKKAQKFSIKGIEQLPEYIHADKHRIFQIISNFVSNAVKYAGKGNVTLEILPTRTNGDDMQAFKVMVHDQGPGISDLLKKKLFKPFSQIHKNEEELIEGSGLGLSICKELANLLGGEIDVDSTPGKGSTFWFSFNARVVEEIRTVSSDPSGTGAKSGLRILLAEDKEVNQKVISLILSSMGHHITLATNGQDAFEKFQPGAFDLVLMDIQMPVMDGVSATKKIKEKYNTTTPVVGLSANAMQGDRERFMDQGMDEYITKPVRTDDFNKLISRLNL